MNLLCEAASEGLVFIASLAGIVQAAWSSFQDGSRRALPDYLCAVLVQLSVGGKDSEVFFERLGNEEPVKRIAMMQGEGFRSQDVIEPKRDEVYSIFAALIAQIGD